MASQAITIPFIELSVLLWNVTHIPQNFPMDLNLCLYLFPLISLCFYPRTIFIIVDWNMCWVSEAHLPFPLRLKDLSSRATLAWVQILLLPLTVRPWRSYIFCASISSSVIGIIIIKTSCRNMRRRNWYNSYRMVIIVPGKA